VAGTSGSSSEGPNPETADRDELIRAASRISAEQRATHGGSSPCPPSPGLQQHGTFQRHTRETISCLPGLQQHGSERASERMQRAGEERLWPVNPSERRDRQASNQVTKSKATKHKRNRERIETIKAASNKREPKQSETVGLGAEKRVGGDRSSYLKLNFPVAWLPTGHDPGAGGGAATTARQRDHIWSWTFWSEEATSRSREAS
jgi:hypothetical protein